VLSYRHAFHAGNHADVLKHLVLVRLLRYLNQKDKPWSLIDTHAGAGMYPLDTGYATQNAEHEGGIARLWQRDDLPQPLAEYVGLIRGLNKGRLRDYPGSPWIAAQHLREDDRMHLFELHPADHALLAEGAAAYGRQVKVAQSDGFAGIKALLPPPSRRGLVLIDPSYEDKRDYARVIDALNEGLKRFSTGIYAVWYPLLARAELRRLRDKLRDLPVHWLDVSLTVRKPHGVASGMFGSGMFVINPPWTLADELRACQPALLDALREDAGAAMTVEVHGD